MYEIVVKVENFNSGKTFFISKPLSFVHNTQGTLNFRSLCFADNAPGIPIKFSFIPPFAFYNSNYMIRITFIIYYIPYDQIASGLENGMEYPSISDHKVFYEYDGTYATLYIELSYLELNPIGSDEENTINFIVPFKSFLFSNNLLIFAQISAISETENIKIAENYKDYNYYASVSQTTDHYHETNEDTQIMFTEIMPYIDGNINDYTIVFTFDRGFRIRGNTILIDNNIISFRLLSSDYPMFNYAVGYIDSISLYDSSYIYFTLDITTPWFIESQQQTYFAYILKSKEFNNENCNNHKLFRFLLSAPKMIYNGYSPVYIIDYPFSEPRFDVSISFKYGNTIYAGSKIKAEISTSYFNILKSKWSIRIGTYALNTDECVSKSSCFSGKLTIDIIDSIITITVHDVTLNEISDDYLKFQGFVYTALYFSDSDNNDIFLQTWAHDEEASENETNFYKASIPIGVSDIKKIWAFPSTKGASLVYFGMSFTSPYYLPLGTTITVYTETFETSNYDVEDSTWCNYGFASAKINSYNRLEIVTMVSINAGETIEIVKDYAFSLDKYADESPQFFITAQFRNYYIINDVQVANGSKLLINDVPNIQITDITISPKIFNKGAKNYYTFSFILNAEAHPSWFYCFDASHNYDANPGDAFTIQGFEDVLFLNAKSSLSVNVYCTINHWIICCTGFNNNIQANSLIDISIYLTNPSSSQASFNVYIVDENFESVVEPKYEVMVYFSEIPQEIVDAYHVSLVNNNYRESSSTVIVDAYIDAYLIGQSLIQIEFPHPFDLKFYNPGYVYCSIHYDRNDDDFNFFYKAESEVEMNYVIVDIKNPKRLKKNYWTRFYFENIILPEFGILKNSQNNYEFEDYNYWTGKFGISIFGKKPYYNDRSIESISKSYSNLNAAYTGYYKNDHKSVIINDGNDIIIKPGTFSPYFPITVDGDLDAYKLTLYTISCPNDVIKFNTHSYILDLIFPQSKFRVGASQKAPEDFYIITWNIYEKPLIPGEFSYRTRQKTKIQIFFGEPYKIVPKSNLFVLAGLNSLPFLIPFPEATPYLGIKISFIPDTDNSVNITFSPNPLKITPNTFSAYFTISCEGCISASKYKFKYELSGYNKDVFTINPKGSFVFDSFSAKKNSVGWINLNIIDQVTASVELITSEDAIVYWALLSKSLFAKNSNYSSIEMIKEVAQSLICNNDCYGKTLEDQIYEYINKLKDADDAELNWEQYSQKLFLVAESTYFAKIDYISAIESPKILYTFKNLIAQIEYVVVAYISNLNTKNPIQVISKGATSKLQNHAELVINFKSTEEIILEKISEIISYSYKVDIRRIISYQTTNRNLDASTYKFTLLSSAFTSVSPVSIANANKNFLNNTFISNDLFVLKIFDATEIKSKSFTTPELQNLEMTDNGFDNVQINFTLNVDGIICCEFEPNANSIKNLTYYEVLVGLSSNGENNNDRHLCEKVVAGELYDFSHNFKNEDYENYVFICNICNNYPILPECAKELIFYEFDWRLEIDSCGTFFVMMEFIIALGFIS